MFKFFRRIRQNLLQQGKLKNYFLYSIGEIILVVIGILIALQINNWNENRKLKAEQQLIYQNLLEEFKLLDPTFKGSMDKSKSIRNATQTIVLQTGIRKEVFTLQAFDSLLAIALDYPVFNPSFTIYKEVTESGKMDLIEQEEVKRLLYLFQTRMEDYNSQEGVVERNLTTHLVKYMSQNIAFKNIDQYLDIIEVGTSKIKEDNRAALMDLEFENLMDNHLFALSTQYRLLEELDKLKDDIITALEQI